ncbi:hypothetical protein [Streptomyces sp. NTH33]|uniref:hypothetical protein n=1 Tax=Streptomyces sp. NTH33 TaxID=1735453 RepID=UPI0015E8B202|nr:hypothetical protein [Streptomyces sp. NTH33]
MDHESGAAPPPAERAADGGAAVLPPRLRASWLGSRRYGVAPDEMRPVFTGSVDEDCLLYERGHEVLRGSMDADTRSARVKALSAIAVAEYQRLARAVDTILASLALLLVAAVLAVAG